MMTMTTRLAIRRQAPAMAPSNRMRAQSSRLSASGDSLTSCNVGSRGATGSRLHSPLVALKPSAHREQSEDVYPGRHL